MGGSRSDKMIHHPQAMSENRLPCHGVSIF
jgi:hypothetical protein